MRCCTHTHKLIIHAYNPYIDTYTYTHRPTCLHTSMHTCAHTYAYMVSVRTPGGADVSPTLALLLLVRQCKGRLPSSLYLETRVVIVYTCKCA